MLTEVTGQAVVQVLVELGTVSPLQPRAQAKVRQLHVTLEAQMFYTPSISISLADEGVSIFFGYPSKLSENSIPLPCCMTDKL